MTPKVLIQEALEARNYAYVPYSSFKVGAALLTSAGLVYTGCNIENASYSPTNCAERTAIFKAISAGERKFAAMAVVGDTERPISPCGVCRQVMAEFFPPDLPVYLANMQGDQWSTTIGELLPGAFTKADLMEES